MSSIEMMEQTWERCEKAMGSPETEALLLEMDKFALGLKKSKAWDRLWEWDVSKAEYIAGKIIDRIFITSGSYPGAIYYDGTIQGLVTKLETWSTKS